MPNWKNPFPATTPVTLESTLKVLDKFIFEPQPYLRRAHDAIEGHGNLLDAYYLRNSRDLSLAIRYGPEDSQYMSFLVPLEAEKELEWDNTMPAWDHSKNADADASAGFIFYWSSKALKNYSPGSIYVVGGNPKQARELAKIEFERWLAQNRYYLDEPEKNEIRKQFAEDLAYPPKCATVWLEQGSE